MSQPWTKKSPISADFSEKNRISVVLEKILEWKNREKKNRRKIADFSNKNRFFLEIFFFLFFS